MLFLEGLTLTFGYNQLSLLFHPQLELQTKIFLHVEFVKSYYKYSFIDLFHKTQEPMTSFTFLVAHAL